MDTIEVVCPACRQRVTPDGIVCPRCGASVAGEVFAARAEALRRLTERAARPPRGGGSTVNGTGTTLLDYRPRGDGTWDAVKWVTFAWFPLVPLRAMHIRPLRREARIAGQEYHYELLGEGKPPPARVLWLYVLAIAGTVPMILAFLRMDDVNRLVGSGKGFFVTLASIVWFAFVMLRFVNADKAYKAAAASESPQAAD